MKTKKSPKNPWANRGIRTVERKAIPKKKVKTKK